MVLGDRVDVLLKLPGAVFIIEALPFAEILHVSISGLSMSHNTLDIPDGFKLFFFAFLVKVEGFGIFSREAGCFQSRLPGLVGFDVVIHPLKASETLEEFVGFVGIVEMRKVFPFDMKSLQQSVFEIRDGVTQKLVLTTFSNQISSGSASLPSSRL